MLVVLFFFLKKKKEGEIDHKLRAAAQGASLGDGKERPRVPTVLRDRATGSQMASQRTLP